MKRTRWLLAAALLLAPATPASPAESGQLDSSPALFSVLAAINIAGYDADLDSPANSPLRAMIRNHLLAKPPACLPELKRFFQEHRQKNAAAELSQYVSFALSTEGPPNFEFRFKEYLLPPDAAPLINLRPLLARFHKEANIDELYRKSQPYFDQVIARYHEPVSKAVLEVNAYLRNPTSGYVGRRFQVYIDLLGAPNQVFSRSYADDYFVVVTPSAEPQVDYVRHAYLHYLLDPMSIRYGEEIRTKRSLEDFALGAPALDESFKNDFVLLTGECVVKAVEARLAPASARPAMIEQALREGFILTPFFAEQLALYEKQEAAMRYFYPEMIQAIDLRKETARLDKVEFLRERVVRRARPAPPPKPAEPPAGAARTLAAAEELYRARQLDKARDMFLQALKETDEKPLHAKAYYGLARIAALRKDPEAAEKLFQRVLELQPDPQTKGWALVYLGRLADAAGERGNALESYRAALAVEGASEGAKEAARLGLQQSFARDK